MLAAYCSLPRPPLHGSVLGPVINPPGGVVRFTCNPGYRLIGINSATCLRRPQGYYDWNSEVPLCQGKSIRTIPQGFCHHIYAANSGRQESNIFTTCIHPRTPATNYFIGRSCQSAGGQGEDFIS